MLIEFQRAAKVFVPLLMLLVLTAESQSLRWGLTLVIVVWGGFALVYRPGG